MKTEIKDALRLIVKELQFIDAVKPEKESLPPRSYERLEHLRVTIEYKDATGNVCTHNVMKANCEPWRFPVLGIGVKTILGVRVLNMQDNCIIADIQF